MQNMGGNAKLRKYIYGCIRFNRDKYIKTYENHFRNGVRFFEQNDSSRLLILNISNGETWQELCIFLNKPLPNVEFPCKNVGYKKN